jgi:hypothetical protein
MSTQPTTRRLVTEAALDTALTGLTGAGTATPAAGSNVLVFTAEADADAAPDGTWLLRFIPGAV